MLKEFKTVSELQKAIYDSTFGSSQLAQALLLSKSIANCGTIDGITSFFFDTAIKAAVVFPLEGIAMMEAQAACSELRELGERADVINYNLVIASEHTMTADEIFKIGVTIGMKLVTLKNKREEKS